MGQIDTSLIMMVVGVIVGVCFLGWLFTASYKKASTDEALLITGTRKRIVIGGAGLAIPLFDRVDRLDLGLASVDVRTESYVPTNDYINIMIDGIVKVQISKDKDMIERAAQNFLNKSIEFIQESVQDVLEGNVREIIGQMTLEDIVKDRQKFVELVSQNAIPDLEKMGLEIISFNIQNIQDQNGVIEDLGIDNISQIKKNAAIAKSEADKEVEIKQSAAKREANIARVEAETDISEQNNRLAIRQSELKQMENIKKAQSESAYDIEREVQRKQLELETAEANKVKTMQDIEIRRNMLTADRNNEEDAKLYAQQKEAEGIKAIAQAKAEAIKVEAEAEAERNRLLAKAEAERVEAIGKAEAESIRKKAEAMAEYQDAAKLELVLDALTKMSGEIVKPLGNIDTITMYGEGNQAKLVQDITNTLNQLSSGMGDSLGVDLSELIKGFINTKKDVTPDDMQE